MPSTFIQLFIIEKFLKIKKFPLTFIQLLITEKIKKH
jgi:hypothetical protein